MQITDSVSHFKNKLKKLTYDVLKIFLAGRWMFRKILTSYFSDLNIIWQIWRDYLWLHVGVWIFIFRMSIVQHETVIKFCWRKCALIEIESAIKNNFLEKYRQLPGWPRELNSSYVTLYLYIIWVLERCALTML